MLGPAYKPVCKAGEAGSCCTHQPEGLLRRWRSLAAAATANDPDRFHQQC